MFDLQAKMRRGRKSERESLYPRERKFLGELSEGKSPTEAAMTAYNPKSRKVASQMGSAIMKRPRFLKVLEKAGITDEFLAGKLMEGFDALKPVATRQGTEMYADYYSRLGYLKTALKLKGHLSYEPPQEQGEPLILRSVQFIQNKVIVNDSLNSGYHERLIDVMQALVIDAGDSVTVADIL